jgi:plasmid stabilization system protein ParE
MSSRRLVFSDASIADILEQAEWYAAQSGQPLAQRWQKAVTTAMSRLLTRPATGGPADFDRQHFAM